MALIVVVEGLAGSGKTTVIELMVKELCTAGFRVEMVDVSTTGYAPALRAMAKSYPNGHPLRIVLFWAIHIQQCDVIREAAARAEIVFVDHFWGSDLAINLYGNLVPREVLGWVGQHKLQPHITFLFEAPIEVVRARKVTKTTSDPDFAHRVRQGFRELAGVYSWIRVDATRKPDEVKDYCLGVIRETLAKRL